MKRLIILAVMTILPMMTKAEVKLPAVLGSNMVLQRNTEVNLWGKADANKRVIVAVSWSKGKVQTTADENGNWVVKVATPAGSFDKYPISISDGEELKLENVMIHLIL